MNLSEKRFSLKRASSRNQVSVGLCGRSAVLAVVIIGWCVAIQGAEIHEAAELGDLEKVKAYLSQDPKQVDLLDGKGRTVLARAARSGKKEVVQFLLAQGATEDIYAAVVVGDVDKVAAFLKQDKKLVSARDSDGRAPLHWAATFNKRGAVELLLANKADMNIKVAKYGWTPLRLAVIHGHMAGAEALLNGGADPNAKDDENIPLLHQAVIRGKKEMVELLLDKKADLNTKDSAGETALDEAEEQGNKEIIELLRQHGAKGK